jgi:general secretion pathway protein G
MNRSAFTLLEIIFVIVVLGILSAIAIPQLSVTREDAVIAKGRSELSTIKNAIMLDRSERLLTGDSAFLTDLDSNVTNNGNGERLFNEILGNNPIYSRNTPGHWLKTTNTTYRYSVNDTTSVTFTYDNTNGTFDCDHTLDPCRRLAE